jgi:hypothetical protein
MIFILVLVSLAMARNHGRIRRDVDDAEFEPYENPDQFVSTSVFVSAGGLSNDNSISPPDFSQTVVLPQSGPLSSASAVSSGGSISFKEDSIEHGSSIEHPSGTHGEEFVSSSASSSSTAVSSGDSVGFEHGSVEHSSTIEHHHHGEGSGSSSASAGASVSVIIKDETTVPPHVVTSTIPPSSTTPPCKKFSFDSSKRIIVHPYKKYWRDLLTQKLPKTHDFNFNFTKKSF